MKKEYILAFVITCAVLAISNASLVIPTIVKPDNLIFLGRRAINSENVYTYISQIEQVRQGRFLTEDLFTSEPQYQNVLQPSYVLIGTTARWLHISSADAYHLFRIIFSILLSAALYAFVTLFFSTVSIRLVAFVIVLTSSGLGFLFSKWITNSIDLWVPEAFTFLTFAEAPHVILSLALVLTGFYFFLKYIKTKHGSALLFTCVACLLLSFEEPASAYIVIPILFFTAIWNAITIPKSLALVAVPAIGLFYHIIEIGSNPVLASVYAQSVLSSPPPVNYMVGFGLLLVLGSIGLEFFFEKQTPEHKLILTWVGAAVLLLYAPLSNQRQLVIGVQIPLAIAAVYGIYRLQKRFGHQRIFIPVCIAILSFGSLYSVYRDFNVLAADPKDNPYYSISSQNIEGIRWLGTQTGFADVILANRYYGNLIPGLIGRKVYLGHSVLTIDLAGKIDKANSFLLEKDDNKALAFLKDNHITYIFLGTNDSMIVYGFSPKPKKYLQIVYDKQGVTIYRVKYPN